ncbi:MAG: hypothetical protein Q9159_003027 [Coniocarpon cinnabarinum]
MHFIKACVLFSTCVLAFPTPGPSEVAEASHVERGDVEGALVETGLAPPPESGLAEEGLVQRETTETDLLESGLASRSDAEDGLLENGLANRETTEDGLLETGLSERANTEEGLLDTKIVDRASTESGLLDNNGAEDGLAVSEKTASSGT